MARTKRTVAQSTQGHSKSTPTEKKRSSQSKKRKGRDPSPENSKRKKLSQVELIEVSDSDESSDFIPEEKFHQGTTWPLDASLEVQVTYEGVKEVRTVKQQFFPLLFHLTRGEPENIAKAITAIKPVYKIFSDRFEKEFKPPSNQSTCVSDVKSTPEKSKTVVSQAEILKKLPKHHFRDAQGKWLPKKQWKVAEILKDKTKLQSLLSGEASQIVSGAQRITELSTAKLAIRNILSRVSLKQTYFASLFDWMRKLKMKSFENPQIPRKTVKKKSNKKTEKKVGKKKEEKKKSNSASKTILNGLEESAIIPDKRLRSKPKFVPYIRPSQSTSKTEGKKQSLPKKKTISYTPYSAAMKNYVQKAQQSRFSGHFKKQPESSRGFSVLFKGRTFSSGKKVTFNENRSFQSDSDSDSESSSSTSSLEEDGGMTSSRILRHQKTAPKTRMCSSAQRNDVRKSPRKISQPNSSTSGKSEKYQSDSNATSSEDGAVDKPVPKKSSPNLLPRIDIQRLSNSVVNSLSSPKTDKQPKIPDIHGSAHLTSKNPERVDSPTSQSPQDGMSEIRITDVKSLTNQEQLFYDKEMETDDKILDMREGQGNFWNGSNQDETGSIRLRKRACDLSDSASKKVAVIIHDDYKELLPLPVIEMSEREVDGMANSQKEAGVDKGLGATEQSRDEGNSHKEPPSVVHCENSESESWSASQMGGERVRVQEKGQSPDSSNVQNAINDVDTAPCSSQSDNSTGSTSNSFKTSSNANTATGSTQCENSKGSADSSKTTNTEETLRLLINQLTSLTSSKDCKIIFSNSNQVLTIGEGRKGSRRERSMDIKPNVDQINLQESSQIPDSNIGTICKTSNHGNLSRTGNPSFDGGVRGENTTIPNVQVKEERQWAGLGNQTEADAIIITDSDDE